MEINFYKLSVYDINKGAFDEYSNYWELPVSYHILHGNPERPVEDWGHHWGSAILMFWYDGGGTVDISTEFIDPSGASRGKRSSTKTSGPTGTGCSTAYVEFDKLGTWKIRGTLNGEVKTWDALIIVEIDDPVDPPPPPLAIYDILFWNPYTQEFQEELIDVPLGADIGVKFTTENWLVHGADLTPTIRIYNPVTSAFVSYQGDTIYRVPAEQFSFACIKIGGWTHEGLCLARLCVHHAGYIVWAAYGVPIANIVVAPPPPPPDNFSLEITQYQRI